MHQRGGRRNPKIPPKQEVVLFKLCSDPISATRSADGRAEYSITKWGKKETPRTRGLSKASSSIENSSKLCFPPALQLEEHQTSPTWYRVLLLGTPTMQGLWCEEGGEQCLNCELGCRRCFSSQITQRCSPSSAYIGFSIPLFLFPKHSLLLYGEKKDRTDSKDAVGSLNAFTCWLQPSAYLADAGEPSWAPLGSAASCSSHLRLKF